MPDQIYIILGVLIILGFIFIWLSLRAWAAKRLLAAGVNTLAAMLLISLFALCFLLLANIYSYQQFIYEDVVATLRLKKLTPNSYRIHIHLIAPNQGGRYVVYGDEWQLDARVLKWKNTGTLLGLKPLYRLERLSGRYADPDKNHQAQKVHRLNQSAGIELWKIAQSLERWLPLVDVSYGSASYMPMADGAYYKVSIGTNGLIARPANAIAEHALQRWD